MRAYIGITDFEWFALLAQASPLPEVNFWQPGGQRRFGAIEPGELFLFKLHAPHRAIVGGGFFAHASLLPVSLAWEAFTEANGARSLEEMRSRIEKYRRTSARAAEDYSIGCILLEQPFFLPEPAWIPEPPDWHPNIVQGKRYDLQEEPGRSLWNRVHDAVAGTTSTAAILADAEEPPRYGEPILVPPRLGQGSFRIVVTDAYKRRCAVTGERVLPVLQAAHIRPYARGGDHRIDNGLLLRSDLHTLFDRGYLTITPQHRLEVSRRIREDFDNGRHYYGLHGQGIQVPERPDQRPAGEVLQWHNDEVFLG